MERDCGCGSRTLATWAEVHKFLDQHQQEVWCGNLADAHTHPSLAQLPVSED